MNRNHLTVGSKLNEETRTPGQPPGRSVYSRSRARKDCCLRRVPDIASEVRRALVGDDVSSEEDEILEFYPE